MDLKRSDEASRKRRSPSDRNERISKELLAKVGFCVALCMAVFSHIQNPIMLHLWIYLAAACMAALFGISWLSGLNKRLKSTIE